MNNRATPFFTPLRAALAASAVMAACALPLTAFAQASAAPPAPLAAPTAAPPAASSASAPVGPRLLTPSEKRDNADAVSAPDLRPDRPVIPQISVPLGRKPPAANPPPAAPRNGSASAPGAIGDSAARCEAMPGNLERAACRKRLAQARSPG